MKNQNNIDLLNRGVKNSGNLYQLSIRFNIEDKERFEFMASELGIPISSFMRMVLRQTGGRIYKAIKGVKIIFDPALLGPDEIAVIQDH